MCGENCFEILVAVLTAYKLSENTSGNHCEIWKVIQQDKRKLYAGFVENMYIHFGEEIQLGKH